MVWHPYVYAEMLAAKLEKENCPAYLVNTGWVGGPYGTGNRCSLLYLLRIQLMIFSGFPALHCARSTRRIASSFESFHFPSSLLGWLELTSR